VEVFVNTPLEVCEQRDVKGLYKKARTGELKNFTGISAPYETPVNPFIEIETVKETPEQAVQKILSMIKNKL
jgi:adenylylsulfate kinase